MSDTQIEFNAKCLQTIDNLLDAVNRIEVQTMSYLSRTRNRLSEEKSC